MASPVTRAQQPEIEDAVAAFAAIAEALTAEVGQDELLHLIAERVCGVIGVRRCSMYLRTETGVFRGKVAHNEERNADDWMRRSIAGVEADRFTREILASKGPVLITNALEDPRPIRKVMLEWNIRSMLGVPMILRDEVVGLLFLDNEDEQHEYTEHEQRVATALANLAAVAISQAEHMEKLRESLRKLDRQNKLHRQAVEVERRLTRRALTGAGLDEVGKFVLEMTRKPNAIYDVSFTRRSLSTLPGAESMTPRLLEPEFRSLPDVAEAIRRVSPGEAAVVRAFPEHRLHQRHIVAPITIRDDAWGYVVILEFSGNFTAFDAIVARSAANIVAFEFAAERRTQEIDAYAQESLVRDLLYSLDARASLSRRASFHQLQLESPHVVCLFARREPATGRPPSTDELRAAARSAGVERPFCSSTDTGVSLLVPLAEDTPGRLGVAAAKKTVHEIAQLLHPTYPLVAGISGICRRVDDYPRAANECQQVITSLCTISTDPSVAVLAADDLGVGKLLLADATAATARRFAVDTLGSLLTQDGGELLTTLACFFDAGRNFRATASRLEVHENTVRYRLGRIGELTGLDVARDSNDQMTVQLAILVLRLQGHPGVPAL